MKKERYKFIVSVYLMLIKDNKILLLRRFNTGYEDGNYSLPAGHVDGKETIKEALIREVKEEIGIDLVLEGVELVHLMQRVSIGRLDFFFSYRSWPSRIENKEPHKCDDLRWFDLGNLPDNTIPYIRQAIQSYKDKILFSSVGN